MGKLEKRWKEETLFFNRPSTMTVISGKFKVGVEEIASVRAQELCESRGGRPGLPVLTSLMVSVDVKQH